MAPEILDFTQPFGIQCEGCDLVKKATEIGGKFVLTCTPPSYAEGEAEMLSTQINVEKANVDNMVHGLCQALVGGEPAQTSSWVV